MERRCSVRQVQFRVHGRVTREGIGLFAVGEVVDVCHADDVDEFECALVV